jgi:TonB family protein
VPVRRGQKSFEVEDGNPHWVLFVFFGLRLLILILITTPAFAQSLDGPPTAEAGAPVVAFDIPSQRLAAALKAFSAAASLQLFYEAGLTADHTSNAIRGSFTRTAALRMLLAGTGLAATSFEPGTITILPAPKQSEPVDLRPAKARAMPFTPYFALIQASLRSALCQTPATRTDASKIRVQLWIAPSGTVAQVKLLSSTGSEVRDRVYLDALRALAVGVPPPSMPQPVTLAILPRNSPDAAECHSVDAPTPIRWFSHK